MARDAGTERITGPKSTPSSICWIAGFGLLLSVAVGATGMAQAGFPGAWERWERLQGAGWGDGYHAGRPSGIRPFADLPPNDPRPVHRSAVQNVRGIPPREGTYYDRFDAYCAAVEKGPVRADHSGAGIASNTGIASNAGIVPSQPVRHNGPTPAVTPSLNTAGPDAAGRTTGVRPGMSRARLPQVAIADAPNPDGQGVPSPISNDHSRSPRVAEVPDYLIIRQPR